LSYGDSGELIINIGLYENDQNRLDTDSTMGTGISDTFVKMVGLSILLSILLSIYLSS
jgi:hypothetical protein